MVRCLNDHCTGHCININILLCNKVWEGASGITIDEPGTFDESCRINGRIIEMISLIKSYEEKIKVYEERLRLIEEAPYRPGNLYYSVLDMLPFNLAVISSAGEIRFINRSWANMAGDNCISYETLEELGAYYSRAQRHADGSPPVDASEVLKRNDSMLEGSGDDLRLEYSCTALSGKRWYLMQTAPAMINGGKELIVLNTDITRRKQGEEATVNALDRARFYSQLLGHDINNSTITSIGYLNLALESADDPESSRNYIINTLRVLNNSSQLIKNINKIQVTESGSTETVLIELNHLISDISRSYMDMPGKSIMIRLASSDNVYTMANDLLRDAIDNIISNATRHGGDTITIGISASSATFGGQVYHAVTVEDNGQGIPDDLKCRVFDRYYRGKASAGGIGLGLYLARALIDGLGGKIWVEDCVRGEQNKGCRFVVLLPAVTA